MKKNKESSKGQSVKAEDITRTKLEKIFLTGWRPYFWIMVVGFLVFFRVLFFDFTTHDDTLLIVKNYEYISNLSNLPKLFIEDVFPSFIPVDIYYRPILNLSFMLDAQIGGKSPFIYHLTNVLLHIGVSCCVFVLLAKIFRKTLGVFFISLIFLVHPIQVHAIAWIPGRNDILLALFSIVSVIAFLYYAKKSSPGSFVLHVISFFIALLTKETAVVIPCILLLYIFLFHRNIIFSRKNIILYVGWIFCIIPWYYLREMTVSNASIGQFKLPLDLFFTNLKGVFLYIGKIFFPINLTPLPMLQNSTLVYGFIAIAIIFFLLVSFPKKYKEFLWLGAVWFFGLLIPPLLRFDQTTPIEYLEHRMYLPFVGVLFFLLSINFSGLLKVNQNVRIVLSTALIILFSIVSFKHSQIYRDGWSYWTMVIKDSPQSALGYQGIGDLYFDKGEYEKALIEYQKALRIEPNRFDFHYDLGLAYEKLGYLKEAEESFRKALALYPNFSDAQKDLAAVLDKQGIYEGIDEEFQRALQLDPNSAILHNNYGISLSKRGMLEQAEKEFLTALMLNPEYGNAHYNIAMLYYVMQKYDEAIKHCDKAQRLGVAVSEEFLTLLKPYRE